MHKLILHPDCKSGPIHSVSADIDATDNGCTAVFKLEGDVGAIKIPAHDVSERTDDLWKTTCFEIFWQPQGGIYYREFNLSPSSRWAAYDFDDFRENSRDAPVNAISIACSHSDANGRGELVLKTAITADLPLPADIALNAIVEDKQGNIQFWALAFPPGKAEFHSIQCRAIFMSGEGQKS